MKEIIVFIQFIVMAISQSNNSIDCNKYFSKFGTKESPLAFSGDAIYFQESLQVQINVRYTDILFDDPLYFGLVQEDEKSQETTCFRLKVSQFTATNRQSSSQLISDLPITTSNNTINKWRYYSFKIPISQLDYKLVTNKFSNNSIYSGYYAFSFKPAYQKDIAQDIKYEFNFYFNLTLDNTTQTLVETTFRSPFLAEFTDFFKSQSILLWCADITCQSYLDEDPDIHLSDKFFLQQIIVDSDFIDQQFNSTEVWYTDIGLNKKATPNEIINTTPGQVILELRAEIAWRTLTILVKSQSSIAPYQNYAVNTIFTSFKPLQQCEYDTEPEVKWCTDLTCQTFLNEIPDLHYGDLFILSLNVALYGCSNLTLNRPEVLFTGNGMYDKATLVQVFQVISNFSIQAIFQVKADVVGTEITIKVSLVKPTILGSNIIFSEIQSTTDVINCIKPEGQETCATCDEEEKINGFAHSNCKGCDNYSFFEFVKMILLLIFII